MTHYIAKQYNETLMIRAPHALRPRQDWANWHES
jgi:hypothetical protein